MKTTNIGILGSGDVGQALGHGFAALGNQVKIGSRNAKSEKLKAWVTKEGARLLEPMCWLWVMVGARTGAWNHAFTLVRK